MIPVDQLKYIDTESNVSKVLHVLAASRGPITATDIRIQLDNALKPSQVNSSLTRIRESPYCELRIVKHGSVYTYELIKMTDYVSNALKLAGKLKACHKRQTPKLTDSQKLLNKVFI